MAMACIERTGQTLSPRNTEYTFWIAKSLSVLQRIPVIEGVSARTCLSPFLSKNEFLVSLHSTYMYKKLHSDKSL